MRSKTGNLTGEYVKCKAGVGEVSAVTSATVTCVTVRKEIVSTMLWVPYVRRYLRYVQLRVRSILVGAIHMQCCTRLPQRC